MSNNNTYRIDIRIESILSKDEMPDLYRVNPKNFYTLSETSEDKKVFIYTNNIEEIDVVDEKTSKEINRFLDIGRLSCILDVVEMVDCLNNVREFNGLDKIPYENYC